MTKSEAAYYEDLFVRNPNWNKATPNADEQARWECIKDFLDRYFEAGCDRSILDVGCGRGWMTYLLSSYGTATGVDPIGSVIEHARRLFPAIRFETTVPEGQYDAIVSSEVIEHLVNKLAFLHNLYRLLKWGGILVITTPRGELYGEWTARHGEQPREPRREWITTGELLALLRSVGFHVLESTTAFKLAIYQVHVCSTAPPLVEKK